MEGMFCDCISLQKLYLNNFHTPNVNNMNSMFSNCKSLLILEIKNFTTSSVKNMAYMFSGCSSLTSLNISNFDTSSVTDMFSMFANCSTLKSLDLNMFETSSVLDMTFMFFNCCLLESLEISNFNTSSVAKMDFMFSDCSSLHSLNLSNFYFNLSIDISYDYLFSECNEYLIYCINEEKQDILKKLLNQFTYNCSYFCSKESKKLINGTNICIENCGNDAKYEYKNICYKSCPDGSNILSDHSYLCNDLNCEHFYNYNQNECLQSIPEGYFLNSTQYKTIDKCHEDCKTCHKKQTINNTNCASCPNNKFLDLGNCISLCINGYINNSNICNCPNNACLECSLESIKYNLCISCNIENNFYPKYNDNSNINNFIKCYKELEGHFLYNNTFYQCYPSCNKCNGFGNETNNNCIDCKFNYELKRDKDNSFNCYKKSNIDEKFNATDFFNNKNKTNYNTTKDEIITDIKNQLMNRSLDSIISNVIEGEKKDLLIKDDNIQYQMTSSNNQKNNKYDNISTIMLGECEKILKEKNNININQSLIIFKIDYYQPNSLIPIIGYEIFHPVTKEQLNLTICKDTIVNFNIPVSIFQISNLF